MARLILVMTERETSRINTHTTLPRRRLIVQEAAAIIMVHGATILLILAR
jgi:hypothetical protein